MQNRKANHDGSTASIYVGGALQKTSGKWRAFIYVDKKNKFLGYHATAEDAAKAYDKALVERGISAVNILVY